MEVMACLDEPQFQDNDVILIEETRDKSLPVIVAWGITNPRNALVKIVVLNVGQQAATIHKGKEVATAENVQCETTPISTVKEENKDMKKRNFGPDVKQEEKSCFRSPSFIVGDISQWSCSRPK